MAYRRTVYGQGGPSRSQSSRFNRHDDPLADEQARTGRQLREAINFLTSANVETDEDFEARLLALDEHMVKGYPTTGVAYGQRLYNQVKALVQEHKKELMELHDYQGGSDIELDVPEEYDSELSDSEDHGLPRTALRRSKTGAGSDVKDKDRKRSQLRRLRGAFQSRTKSPGKDSLASLKKVVEDVTRQDRRLTERAVLTEHKQTRGPFAKLSAEDKDEVQKSRELALRALAKKQVDPVARAMPPPRAPQTNPLVPIAQPQPSVQEPKYGHNIREIEWDYGGPGNDPEYWHADMPSSLPFGETFHLAKWESDRIVYDLAQSAIKAAKRQTVGTNPKGKGKEKASGEDDDDFIVHTNVPYQKEDKRQHLEPDVAWWESGTNFKLPEPRAEVVELAKTHQASVFNLKRIVDRFNVVSEADINNKTCAPRRALPHFLPQVQPHPENQVQPEFLAGLNRVTQRHVSLESGNESESQESTEAITVGQPPITPSPPHPTVTPRKTPRRPTTSSGTVGEGVPEIIDQHSAPDPVGTGDKEANLNTIDECLWNNHMTRSTTARLSGSNVLSSAHPSPSKSRSQPSPSARITLSSQPKAKEKVAAASSAATRAMKRTRPEDVEEEGAGEGSSSRKKAKGKRVAFEEKTYRWDPEQEEGDSPTRARRAPTMRAAKASRRK